ncbi:hypothetical protein DVA67_000905 [Solirubrobacter sp. CPCC 204708]|uniref:Major facilitator superfamily (MFS) profile domain-containing protein n=1 Tax=Solirubrobacter deserti TaxID=2282478 RepID=A0ABT4RDD0_9ACTN|nr:hypothetical protein [Solirubrobacter deserti]MBE2314517.1 hypothetical protein [Solirubrobacter deserti]MDA0136522.1 hypothetical protein [Solirubrobacter deserti]
MTRALAVLTALVLGLAALAVAFVGVFVAADAADPASEPQPAAVGFGFALVEGVLLGAVLALVVYAVAGRFAAWGWLVAAPVAVALGLAGLLTLA